MVVQDEVGRDLGTHDRVRPCGFEGNALLSGVHLRAMAFAACFEQLAPRVCRSGGGASGGLQRDESVEGVAALAPALDDGEGVIQSPCDEMDK